jgi:uncharacterized membrane protein YdfJ with MMPL/SSD domain
VRRQQASDDGARWGPRIFARLSRAQTARPGIFCYLGLALAGISLLFALKLQLHLRFEQLLPETRPSVIELARLTASVPSSSHCFVVVEGSSRSAKRRFGDALVERLRRHAPAWLADASDGVHDARAFLAPRAGLFVSLAELEKLRDDVEARWSWEIANQTGANVDDAPAPELSFASLQQRLALSNTERFPDGYYEAPDGSALVVSVSTSLQAGDLAGMQQGLDFVRAEAERLEAEQSPGLRLSYAGDLVTGLAEYGAVTRDLLNVGGLGVGLVLLVLLLYFRRLSALLALALTLAAGLAVTFGLTELAIGHLNAATGFLVSIVAGNGINFAIIFLARYYEERRAGASIEVALDVAHGQTWPGTLVAALAAAAAYASLGICELRAFRDFAVIGSTGMLVCWLVTYLLLPALVVLFERRRATAAALTPPRAVTREPGYGYGRPAAALVARAPRLLVCGGVGLALAGAAALVPYVQSDPMEYDMRQMQNNLGESTEMYRASRVSSAILGAERDSAMVLLADRPSQVPELQRVLLARRDRAPEGLKPLEGVHTAFDFVPEDQAAKLPVLRQIAARAKKAHARGFLSDADFAKLEPYLPPDTLQPFTLTDLPLAIARPFTDRAGVVGRLALIEPTAGQSDSDVKYLMRWADAFRSVPLPDGETVQGSGRAVIFADILATVLRDIPRTVLLAFVMTLGAVLLVFRRGIQPLLVMASLLVGLGWVVLAMRYLDLKLNFFNFVALPVSFGIGVDYAVNLVQRYSAEPERGALGALRSTGGAVVLCSLTASLGYLALLGSVNQAIRSLGLLAMLGEIGCLLAATLVLPAYLHWQERERSKVSRTSGGAARVNSTELDAELH